MKILRNFFFHVFSRQLNVLQEGMFQNCSVFAQELRYMKIKTVHFLYRNNVLFILVYETSFIISNDRQAMQKFFHAFAHVAN